MIDLGDLGIRFVPVDRWPGSRTEARRSSPFRADWSTTLEDLRRELGALGAQNVLLQTFHTAGQIRRDGIPYANARTPDDPGVILTFDSRVGPLSFPCDTFDRWQDNVRAIVLAMEALRRVDRYGVTRRGEQYRGWGALPPAGGSSSTMTAEAAALFISRHSELAAQDILEHPGDAADAYRFAAKRLHPDAGGSVEAFQRLQEAKRILDRHHGL